MKLIKKFFNFLSQIDNCCLQKKTYHLFFIKSLVFFLSFMQSSIGLAIGPEAHFLNFSPIVEVKSTHFAGTGTLFMIEGEPHVLTSSHVIFNTPKIQVVDQASSIIKVRLAELNKSAFIGYVIPKYDLPVELIHDDPLADFSILKVNLKKDESKLSSLVYYWSSQSFSISKEGKLKLVKNIDWNLPLSNGLIGMGDEISFNPELSTKLFKAVLTPIVAPYNIEIEPDTVISGLFEEQIRIPTFAKPGMSGSIIVKDNKLIGIVSKVLLDGGPMAYGVKLQDIAKRFGQVQRYQQEVKLVRDATAYWHKVENKMVLQFYGGNGYWFRQPLRSLTETMAGGDLTNGGGDLTNGGGDLINGGESSQLQSQSRHWSFLSSQVVGFNGLLSTLSVVNPFSKGAPQYFEISTQDNKKWRSVSLLKIRDENNKPIYKIPSLPGFMVLKNRLEFDQNLNEFFIDSGIENLDSVRVESNQKLEPKYFRYALKVDSEKICFPSIGNSWTWDNTMAVKAEDSKSLLNAAEDAIKKSIGISTDTEFRSALQSLQYSSTQDGKQRVGLFIFDLNDKSKLLNVSSELGGLTDKYTECLKSINSSLSKTERDAVLKELKSQLKNYNMIINKQDLNSLSIVESITDLTSAHSKKEYKTYSLKRVSALDSASVLYEDSSNSGMRALMIFDRDNLANLERVYIDTPHLLFEFIYAPLNSKRVR